MADAWGGSWGSAWGVSWGSGSTPTVVVSDNYLPPKRRKPWWQLEDERRGIRSAMDSVLDATKSTRVPAAVRNAAAEAQRALETGRELEAQQQAIREFQALAKLALDLRIREAEMRSALTVLEIWAERLRDDDEAAAALLLH